MRRGRPANKPKRINRVFKEWFDSQYRTFEEAANALRVSRGSVCNWYHAINMPSFGSMERIAKASNNKVTHQSWIDTVKS